MNAFCRCHSRSGTGGSRSFVCAFWRIALPVYDTVIEVSGVSESLDVVTKYSEEYLALEERAQVEQCAAEVLPGRIL